MNTPPQGAGVDLNQFNQVFFEECVEHLGEMEQILINLGSAEPDTEQLNAIFRAAHSIKGGAGIFGFDDMTVVTHVLESLLDRVRNREIPYSATMVDVFLEAGDVITMQLAGHRDGATVDSEAIRQVSQKLQQMIETGGNLLDASPSPSPQPEAEDSGAFRRFELSFTPDRNIFQRGVRIEGILAELGDLGEVVASAQLFEVPELKNFDPECCITRWNMVLETTANKQEVMDVFMFVADEEQLVIREVPFPTAPGKADPTVAPTPVELLNETAPVLGRRLYDRDETAPGSYGRRGVETESSIRVNVAKVDLLINQIGELLITQAMLVQTVAGLDPMLHESLHKGITQLERNCRDLQQSVMSIRLVPISVVFNRFPRMVRELASKLGKNVEFKTQGATTELDKGLIEKIADPLSHLVRNSLDHGLETPEARQAQGKKPVGTLELRASQIGGRIVIEVVDDGAGLSRDRILSKAMEKGIPCSAEMTDEEVWQLIFAPGFSTAEAVTDISGRGVGMDVVLRNVQSIGGRVQLSSETGRGTNVTISLPLTLAILEGLCVAVGEEKYIIPLNSVVESLQPRKDQLKSVNGKAVVQVREEFIPLIPLHRLFDQKNCQTEAEAGILVLVDVDGEKGALLVDALLDELQVVVKSVETNFRRIEGSAGATILGDGRVALILEVGEIFQMHKRMQREQLTAEKEGGMKRWSRAS